MHMPTVKPVIYIGADSREMTDNELAQYEKDQIEIANQLAKKAAARQAVLDKLGLTQDEAQALLG